VRGNKLRLLDRKDNQKLEEKVAELRKYIIIMNCYAGSGHPGGSLSIAEIITYLFNCELNFSINNYLDQNRDRFILSKGHSCLALYAALAQKGFFNKKEFKKLRHVNGMLQGHPDRLKTPGVEFNSGSLGQGFSFALGCALGGKLNNRDFRVYVLLGDGELNEGQVWEGFMFGAFHKLDNIVAIIDNNRLQSDDLNTNITALEPITEKLQAFGWQVIEINGHNVILAHTIKGKGISFMENDPKWHGSLSPQGEERKIALKECEMENLEI
jgi:transketolase